MNILNYFFPSTYKFPDSKYNKNISVLSFINSTTLVVDGLVESGDVMTHVWKKAIKKLLPKKFKPKKVLLLGLAGGCNAHLINHYYPDSIITAVEIDSQMVDLGKKYFKLGKVKNLNVVIDDAIEYVMNLKEDDKFDLVMVDCFIGKEIPKKFETISFLNALKKHGRFILINRLWWQEYKIQTSNFLRSISSHFFFIKAHTISNVIISLV